MMRQLVYLVFLFICLCSFNKAQQGVSIFFKNASQEDFKTLHVRIFGKDYYFNDLKSGQTTKPINVERTYRYCFAEAITQRDTVICQPIDYVGETLHRMGKLTMELYIFPEDGKERGLRIR